MRPEIHEAFETLDYAMRSERRCGKSGLNWLELIKDYILEIQRDLDAVMGGNIAAVGTAEVMRRSMQDIVQIIGPEAPGCCGCSWEWNEALRIAAEAGISYRHRR